MYKEKRFLICDTETVGLNNRAFIYDFAYVIATRKRIIIERSFLIREVITNPRTMLFAMNNKKWRQSFGGKIFSHYIPKLATGKLSVHGWRDVIDYLREDMLTYDVQVFSAYNLKFDTGAMTRTQSHICDGGKVLDYKPDMLDLWLFACVAVCNTQLYHDVARQLGRELGWITKTGNVRTTAEKTYAFLSGDYDFIESHTALEDALMETEILQRLLAKKKTIPYNRGDAMPWRFAQRIGRKLF